MKRPTLEDQIEVSKMTREECVEALRPHGFWQTLDFWLFCHCELLWSILHWIRNKSLGGDDGG